MTELTMQIVYNLKNCVDFFSWDNAVLSAVAKHKDCRYAEDGDYSIIAQKYLKDAFVDCISASVYGSSVKDVLYSFVWYIENGTTLYDAMAYSLMTFPVRKKEKNDNGETVYTYCYGFKELDDET